MVINQLSLLVRPTKIKFSKMSILAQSIKLFTIYMQFVCAGCLLVSYSSLIVFTLIERKLNFRVIFW